MPQKKEDNRQSNFLETCKKCRTKWDCCFGSRPPIIADRRKTIEAYLNKEKIPIANPFVTAEYVFPRENAEGYCTFYDTEGAKCLVHPVKPETCVAGPITFDINKRSGNVEWYVKMEKICRLAGSVYEDNQLLVKHLQSARIEILRLIEGLSPPELEAILKKSEPDTIKIGEEQIRKHEKT